MKMSVRRLACGCPERERLPALRESLFTFRREEFRRRPGQATTKEEAFMNWTRRDFFKAALLLPAGAYLARFQAMAAPYAQMVKITAIKTMQLDNVP